MNAHDTKPAHLQPWDVSRRRLLLGAGALPLATGVD